VLLLLGVPSAWRRRSKSADRATGRPGRIPWVIGRPEDLVVALPISASERHIGLPKNHGASRSQARHHDSIAGWHVMRQSRHASGGPYPCRREQVFDGARNSMEGPPPLTTRPSSVSGTGPCQGFFLGQGHNSIESRVVLLDAFDDPRGAARVTLFAESRRRASRVSRAHANRYHVAARLQQPAPCNTSDRGHRACHPPAPS